MELTEDNTFRVLKRTLSRKEMNHKSRILFPPGSEMADMEVWLISEGWTLEEWKQTERDKKKGLL